MVRYLRLYAYFLQFSFSRAMEFRLDFFFRFFMDIVFYVIQFVFFLVVFRHTPVLGGWDLDQALIFAAATLLLDAIDMTVFSSNTWWFPIFVNRGDLDYHLTRPVSPLFMLMFREFAANSFMNVIVAAGLLAWTLARYPGELAAGNVALFLGLLLVGNLIFICVHWIFLTPVFWLHSVDGLRDVFFTTRMAMDRPHGVFRGWALRLLTTVLPLALVVSYPTAMLFTGPQAGMLVNIAVVLVVGWLLLGVMWRAGLRAYSSASS